MDLWFGEAVRWFQRHTPGGAPIWQGVLILISLRTVARTFVLDEEPHNCLQGQDMCRGDVTCRILLQTMAQVCDDTIYECHTSQRVHCHSVLTALQGNKYFHRCTCNQRRHDTNKCLDIQNFIFLHACVTYDVLRPHPRGNESRHTTRRPDPPEDPYLEHGEEEYYGETSCIRVRKECRLDLTCNKVLNNFRNYCRENKKAGTCVTTERRKCYEAIEEIKSSPLDLMGCTCHMRRTATQDRCHRIQTTIANNTCLVSVPYHIYSSRDRDTRYSDIERMVKEIENPSGYDRESTCIKAFMDCDQDEQCRARMSRFMSTCHPTRHHPGDNHLGNHLPPACHKSDCLDEIQKFYLLVRPELTESLLFCRCREGDKKCDLVRLALLPSCALTEEPPPSCTDVIQRCNEDVYCRVRWQAYEHNCGYDKNVGGCRVGPALCRSAQVRIMGTILTTNCTCALQNEADNKRCEENRRRLQLSNVCKELAISDFHTGVRTAQQNQQVWPDVGPEHQGCQRHLGDKIPLYMTIPSVVRKYHNDSDCSDLCQCLKNGTLVCRNLPCAPKLACKERTDIYAHGASFTDDTRGQCRCIKAEVVCAKAVLKMQPKPGLFLHVGYSLSDRYLIEGHSEMLFEPETVSHKLGALMNGDSAEQFCSLSLYYKYDGNLVYEIVVPRSSPRISREGGCIEPAKMISYMINSRNPAILADAMLSVIKVSQLENIMFHKQTPPPPERSVAIGEASKNIPLTSLLLPSTLLMIYTCASSILL